MSNDTERLQAQVEQLTRQLQHANDGLAQAGVKARDLRRRLDEANEDRRALARAVIVTVKADVPDDVVQACQDALSGRHLNGDADV